MRTLVMGDIHGAYTALIQCLEKAKYDPSADTLIQLGDVTDRYPDVYQCVETLLQIDKLIALKGNHDDWFLEFINTGYHPKNWRYGGKDTIRSYKDHINDSINIQRGTGTKMLLRPKDIPPEHLVFFEKQLFYYIDSENNCFVHAGFDRLLPFNEQQKNNFYLDRALWTEAMSHDVLNEHSSHPFYMHTTFREIFIGHTPTTRWGNDQPMHAANIWNLDTGAGHNGRLSIMDILTKQFWQSDPVCDPGSIMYPLHWF